MRKIGLVGGLSWVSTAEYYRLLNQLAQAALGGHHSAPILLESLDEQAFLDGQAEDPTEARCERMIVAAVRRLLAGGAEVVALCANGVHRFAESIERQCGTGLVHIAEATALEIERQGLTRVGLLGVRKTMEGSFYRDRLARHGIALLVPDPADRLRVHDRITSQLVLGTFTDATRDLFLDLCRALHRRGAQGVVLGCTEIPLLLESSGDLSFPLLSTTDIHCRAIIQAALE